MGVEQVLSGTVMENLSAVVFGDHSVRRMGEEAIVWRKIKENFFLVWLSGACAAYFLSGRGTGKTGVSAGDRDRLAGGRGKLYRLAAYGFADGRYRTEQTKRRDAVGEGTVFYGFGCTGDPCRLRGNQRAISGYGHVKAVVFGASLQENGETFKKVLNGMEAESSLGNSPCIFTTESLGELEEMVEKQELSLGDFLTGLYENRTDVSAQSPVKLADLYRAFHKNMVLPEIPANRN